MPLDPDRLITQLSTVAISPEAVIAEALNLLDDEPIALASSFSPEDILVADWVSSRRPGVTLLAIDTGRLPPETFEVADAVSRQLPVNLVWIHPDPTALETLENEQGAFGFRESLANRQRCCAVRKVDVLERGLQGYTAWFTGLRRDQAVTRASLPVAERETRFAPTLKINPLATLTRMDVHRESVARNLPQHPLLDQGYLSIGCAPCTRAVKPGADERSGRWWWEDPDHKECGLHLKPTNPPGAS